MFAYERERASSPKLKGEKSVQRPKRLHEFYRKDDLNRLANNHNIVIIHQTCEFLLFKAYDKVVADS